MERLTRNWPSRWQKEAELDEVIRQKLGALAMASSGMRKLGEIADFGTGLGSSGRNTRHRNRLGESI